MDTCICCGREILEGETKVAILGLHEDSFSLIGFMCEKCHENIEEEDVDEK